MIVCNCMCRSRICEMLISFGLCIVSSFITKAIVCSGWVGRKGMNYRKRAYVLSIQHKSHEVICISVVVISSLFYTGISIKDPELDYNNPSKMNRSQTYRASSFYIGLVKGTLVSNNSLSPWVCVRVRVRDPRCCSSCRSILLAHPKRNFLNCDLCTCLYSNVFCTILYHKTFPNTLMATSHMRRRPMNIVF